MEHKCCSGSERVLLSGNKEKSHVSRITFTLRNLSGGECLKLFMKCKRSGGLGRCYVGVTYYSGDEILSTSDPFRYEIISEELSDYCFKFEAADGADKAELTAHCMGDAELLIEKIRAEKGSRS